MKWKYAEFIRAECMSGQHRRPPECTSSMRLCLQSQSWKDRIYILDKQSNNRLYSTCLVIVRAIRLGFFTEESASHLLIHSLTTAKRIHPSHSQKTNKYHWQSNENTTDEQIAALHTHSWGVPYHWGVPFINRFPWRLVICYRGVPYN